jgi:hypothetical protein
MAEETSQPGGRPGIAADQGKQPTPRAGISGLTLTVSLLLVAGAAAGGAFSALVNYDLVGVGHLPRIAVFCVLLLIGVNALFAWARKRRPFSTKQLAFVYIAILVMAGLPGQQLVTYLYLGMVGSQYHAAGQGNDYTTEVIPYIKPWMVPDMDPESPSIAWAFHGLPYGETVPWQPWLRPLLMWTPFLLALLGLQICLAALFRKRWDEERLTYPLSQAPVELITYDTAKATVPKLMTSPLFWAMFAIPVVIHTHNAIALQVPYILPWNLNKNIGVIFGEPPWNNLDGLPIPIYFETIGATYMIPVATGFSLWFFWLLRRFIYIYRTQRGLINHEAYLTQQGIGAYYWLTGLCVWGARKSLARALRGSIHWRVERDDYHPDEEPMHPRTAVWGVVLSLAVITVWGLAAGGQVLPILFLMFNYIAGLVVLSRLVAESGLFAVWTPLSPPQEIVARFWPKDHGIAPQALTSLCYMGWKTQDLASATMANVLQGYKIAEMTKLKASTVVWLIAGALVLGVFASHPSSLYAMYSNGVYALGWWPRSATEGIPSTIHNLGAGRTPYDADARWAMVHGAAIVAGLHFMRATFHRWPFQAFAYAAALGPQFMMDRYGFSIFLGWLVKYLVLKYGGVGSHNKLRPAAFGLIAGNAAVLLFFTVYHYFHPVEGVLVIE